MRPPTYTPGMEMPRGLPRPVAPVPHDGNMLRPVPWSQAEDDWGQIHDKRMTEGSTNSLCLVCGELVMEGFALLVGGTSPHRAPGWWTEVYFNNLGDGYHIADDGPLHGICLKITRAHCRKVREDLACGKLRIAPYIGPYEWLGRS